MDIGELSYKKIILVIFIEILLLPLAINASFAAQPSQMGNNPLGEINSSDNGDPIVDAGPGQATLYLPLGLTTTGNPTYIWSKVKGTKFYNLIVRDTSDNTIINQWFKAESLVPDRNSRLSVKPSKTLVPGDYKWLIQTWSKKNVITPSDENLFTVCTSKSLPGKAILISPRGSIGTIKPAYIWNPIAGATRYRLTVAKINDLNHPVIDDWYDAEDVISNRGAVIRPDNALDPGSYKWRIQAENCLGDGPRSNYMGFIISPSKPGKVSPISPDGLIATRTPVFVWTATQTATEYNLMVENETDLIFNETYPAEEVTQGDKCYVRSPIILPFEDIDFFWKVQAANEEGQGPNSTSLWFETVCAGEKAKMKPRFI